MDEISCTRKLNIEGLPVFIFDSLVSSETIEATYNTLINRGYDSDHASSKLTRSHREWVSEMDLEAFHQENLCKTMSGLVEKCFPDESINFFSVFCNCISYGCYSFMHQDGGENCFSALYYANPEWNVDWGGETTFFNNDGDAVACIAPTPGRIVILDGRILHRAGMPSRYCPYRRYTVSLRCDTDIEVL